MEDIGNQAFDVHVYGGRYGIITKRTAPVWQFLLMDSSFEGQSEAAIHTMEVGFTLVRVRFAHMPVAIRIAPGEVEQLYGRDLQMEDIRGCRAAVGQRAKPALGSDAGQHRMQRCTGLLSRQIRPSPRHRSIMSWNGSDARAGNR